MTLISVAYMAQVDREEPSPYPDAGCRTPFWGQACYGGEREFKFTGIRDSFFRRVLTDF